MNDDHDLLKTSERHSDLETLNDTIGKAKNAVLTHTKTAAVDQTPNSDDLYIGMRNNTAGSSGVSAVKFAEILIFPTALSDTDRQSVERYLNAKWAIY